MVEVSELSQYGAIKKITVEASVRDFVKLKEKLSKFENYLENLLSKSFKMPELVAEYLEALPIGYLHGAVFSMKEILEEKKFELLNGDARSDSSLGKLKAMRLLEGIAALDLSCSDRRLFRRSAALTDQVGKKAEDILSVIRGKGDHARMVNSSPEEESKGHSHGSSGGSKTYY